MPPLQWLPLAVLGVVVFVWQWDAASGPKSALWRGWAWGLGHFAVGSYWILDAFFVPPADYAFAGPPIVIGLAALRDSSWPRRCSGKVGCAALAAARWTPLPAAAARHCLDGDGMAARAPLHRLPMEPARPCLGLRNTADPECRAVRCLWTRPYELPRACCPGGRLAGVDSGIGVGWPRGLWRADGHGAGQRGRRPAGAHRAAQHATGRKVAAGESRETVGQARGDEPARGLRPAECRGLAGDGAAVHRRARLTGAGR